MDTIKIDQRLDRIEKLLLFKKRVLTFEEACEYTGIKASYMYKLTSSQSIPHSKPNGKFIFFDKEKLDNWLLQNNRKTSQDIETKALKYTLSKKRH